MADMALALSALFVLTLGLRYLWMDYLAQSWMLVCVDYVLRRGADEGWTPEVRLLKVLDYSAVWPMSQMLSHFWIWDFRRFIVNETEATNILDFYAQRANLKGR